MPIVIIMLALLFTTAECATFSALAKLPKIGIIGGGIGGTSCAYYLKSIFGRNVEIDLYEADTIGGRLATEKLGAYSYEIGGAVIHPRNEYMSHFLEKFNLTKRFGDASYFGLYNGKEMVFSESEWKAVTAASLFWRYGMNVFKLNKYIDSLLDNFSRIYELQNQGISFENVTSLLNAMSSEFVESLHVSSNEGFKKAGISQRVVDELIMASLKVNYGQTTGVHQFVGSVSVAGASDGLFAIQHGNKQVPEELLKASQARLISQLVTSVQRLDNGRINIQVGSRSDIPVEPDIKSYDIVIIATPQTPDIKHQIQFKRFEDEITFQGRYHQTVCTLVKGNLNYSYIPDTPKYVDAIFTIKDQLLFNSVSRVTPVDEGQTKRNTWKVFSQSPLTDRELGLLFADKKDVFVKAWLAYPEYDVSKRNDMFRLSKNLYHVNAIEWAASAMEMSVIGARNVALLAKKDWCEQHEGCAIKPSQHVRNEL